MVEQIRIGELEFAAHASKAQVARTERQAFDAGGHSGAGAHHARLNGGVERGTLQAIIPDGRRALAHRQNLGMRSWVVAFDRSVPPAPDHAILENHDSAYGHFTGV